MAQLSGQGESYHEVVYRQRFIDLSFKPVGGLMVLTGGTVSMTTRQWHRLDFTAVLTTPRGGTDREKTGTAIVGCPAVKICVRVLTKY